MDTNNNPLQQIVLAGVGALAIGAEKTQELVNDLVAKGQITVDQGKDIAQNLSNQTKDDVAKVRDEIITAHLKTMTPEERDEFANRVAEMAAKIDDEQDK